MNIIEWLLQSDPAVKRLTRKYLLSEAYEYTEEGWRDAPSDRTEDGGIRFTGRSDRLYRIQCKGIADRPFTVELDPSGKVEIVKR